MKIRKYFIHRNTDSLKKNENKMKLCTSGNAGKDFTAIKRQEYNRVKSLQKQILKPPILLGLEYQII